jgi:hypothetical protein
MNVGFPTTGRTIPLRAAAEARLPAGTADRADGPPPEAMAEVREAARCAQRLHEQGRELRFERDASGRICAELRDLRGDTIQRVPLADVLEVGRRGEIGRRGEVG